MSVTVRIKQKALFKKKLNIEQIIKLTNLSYGVSDENYRLINGKIGNHTLIYNEKYLSRGIDISLDNSDILLILSLPTSKDEIRCFYDVILKICSYLGTNTFIREEKKVYLKDKEKFIKYDEDGSISGLEDLLEKLGNNNYNRFEIFGIYNPISIGIKELKEFGNNLDKFGEFLNRIQNMDVYYAAPVVYNVNNRLVGIYAIGEDILSVVPLEPYIVLNQIQGINDWYVMFDEGKTITYDDFINNVKKTDYYDANHLIVNLSKKEIESLVSKYFTKI